MTQTFLYLYYSCLSFLPLFHNTNLYPRPPNSQSSLGSGAVESGLLTLKVIHSAKNVLVICFVALALTVPVYVFAVLRYILFDAQTVGVFSFVPIWLFHCNSWMNSFLHMVLHRSIRHKLRLMFTILFDAQTVAVFSIAPIWLFHCISCMNSFLYMVLHRSIRHEAHVHLSVRVLWL